VGDRSGQTRPKKSRDGADRVKSSRARLRLIHAEVRSTIQLNEFLDREALLAMAFWPVAATPAVLIKDLFAHSIANCRALQTKMGVPPAMPGGSKKFDVFGMVH
jgi:hypothetical protein